MTNIGGALLRVLGAADRKKDEPNPASRADSFEIIDALMQSKELRQRCSALFTLVQDVPVEARKQTCRALLIMMQNVRAPNESPPRNAAGEIDYARFRNTTPEYVALAAPLPNGKWADHVEAKYRRSAAAEFVRVSPYLAEMLETFEALFGIRGALLAKSSVR